MSGFTRVSAKLGRMRKPQDFLVSPTSDGRVMVQSDKSIGIFDKTGVGRFTTKGPYFPHLAFAPPFEFPPEFVTACLEACPAMGSQTVLGGGAVVVENTIEVAGGPSVSP